LCENIKKKGLHVVIERLVIEEQLDEKTEVLTVDLVRIPVHFKYREALVPKKKRLISITTLGTGIA
jgi:hypothetical protein